MSNHGSDGPARGPWSRAALPFAVIAVNVLALFLVTQAAAGQSHAPLAAENAVSPPRPHVDSEGTSNVETSKPVISGYQLVIMFVVTSVAVAVPVVIFMFLLRKDDFPQRASHYFGSGQWLELVVIGAIVGDVFMLSVSGRLESAQAATIFSGIIGYTLGRKYPSREAVATKPETK